MPSLFDDARAAWGAAPPATKPTPMPASARTEFMVHYDGGAPVVVKDHAGCLARVKQDQGFHMAGRGWSDIGYNGLVCQHGRAIEGRGADAVGAHCPNHNASAYGWQFMVGGDQAPTPAAFARMAAALVACEARSGRPLRKLGHLDGFATACPGPTVIAWVRRGMPAPATTPTEGDPLMAETDAREMWTAYPIVKDTRTDAPDDRTTPSTLLEFTAAQTRANTTAIAALAAAVKAAAAPTVDVDALARAIVLELGKP